jgi:hypothetical protein
VNDGYLHYGDVIGVEDRWGKWLSGNQNDTVEMKGALGAWERWIVESTHANFRAGDRVLVNGPLRLRSEAWTGRRLYMTSSDGLKLTGATSTSEWRINGPFVTR